MLFTCTEGLANNSPSHKNFIVIENCEALTLNKKYLPEIFSAVPKFETLFNKKLSEELTQLLLNEQKSKTLTVEERYLSLEHSFSGKGFSYKKIQEKFPMLKDYSRELAYSISSGIIFSVLPLVMLYSDSIRFHFTFYNWCEEYGTLYFVLAFRLMLFMHDTYFYWDHRIMDHPSLFIRIHLVHHKSSNPSLWAAYVFHPLEAIVESFIFVVFLFTIPVHSIRLMWFFIFSHIYNMYGHLGFEIYPKGFNRYWLGRWINTSVCHNLHHQNIIR